MEKLMGREEEENKKMNARLAGAVVVSQYWDKKMGKRKKNEEWKV